MNKQLVQAFSPVYADSHKRINITLYYHIREWKVEEERERESGITVTNRLAFSSSWRLPSLRIIVWSLWSLEGLE